jgi:hypothetical protein
MYSFTSFQTEVLIMLPSVFAVCIPWQWHMGNITFLLIVNLSCWWLRHHYWGMWNFVQHLTTRLPSKLLLITSSVFKLQLNWHILTILVLVWQRSSNSLIFWCVTSGVPIIHRDTQHAEQRVLPIVYHGLYYAAYFEFPSVHITLLV